MSNKKLSDRIRNSGLIISYAMASIAIIFSIWSCLLISNSPQLNVLVFICGGLIGWILGILITPFSNDEKVKFSEFGKAIATFSSGFLLAKIERILEISI